MQNRLTVLFLVLSSQALLTAAEVTIHASDIPLGEYTVTPFTSADGKLEFAMTGSTYSTGGAAPTSFGGAELGANANAFDNDDGSTMSLTFANDAGLREFASIWTNTSVEISGFTGDPGVSTEGPGNATVSYDSDSGTATLGQAWAGGNPVIYSFANPSASAGQTLTFTFGGGGSSYQWAINRITYEDALTDGPPVITTELAAMTDTIVDVITILSVESDPSVLPLPTYSWEFDNGGGFAEVGTEATYTFEGGADADGTYRVTLRNPSGSVSSMTIVSSTDDGDGVNNQWEVDFFGDHLLHAAAADPDGDGRSNAQEIDNGTDPTNADSDNDGLNDGEEEEGGTNPLNRDSDGDGYSDGYEVGTSLTSPTDAGDSPGTSAGRNSVGITFGSSRGLNQGVNLSPGAIAGAPEYAQQNWNATEVLGDLGAISQDNIALPNAGVLVDSNGDATTMGFDIGVVSTWSTNFNSDLPIGGLLSGYLHITNASPNGSLILSDVPYSRYDVVIYLINQGGNGRARIRQVGSDPLREYTVRTPLLVQQGNEPVWGTSFDPSAAVDNSNENFPSATHVIFRGLTDSTATFDLSFEFDNVGFAAVQVVEHLDGDSDGMGDFYETAVGLDPADDGTTDSAKEGAAGDFDNDGLTNIREYERGTNPTEADSDNDGADDMAETDTGFFIVSDDAGTDPLIADTDGDGVNDGLEIAAGIDPLSDGDTDGDGYFDSYELAVGNTDPNNANDPGPPSGQDPLSFGIAFNSSSGPGSDTSFGPLVYAGAPGVEQNNWNRTFDLANSGLETVGGVNDIEGPQFSALVDSVGDPLSNVSFEFTSQGGAFAGFSETRTPFGRLFNSWIYGPADEETIVSVGNIPYPEYDAYVYFGADGNNRRGTITGAGTTYSFSTDSNPTRATSQAGANYVATDDTEGGYPRANFAVFRGLTDPSFVTSTTWTAEDNGNLGIYGVQIVSTQSRGGQEIILRNLVIANSRFFADLITPRAGTHLLERSQTLNDDWETVGEPFEAPAGESEVFDPAPPAGTVFYRVRRQ